MKKLSLFVVLLVYCMHGFAQTTRYVTTGGAGNKDGSSWENASNDLQEMINASAVDDKIFVAIGIYKAERQVHLFNGEKTPKHRDNAFVLTKSVKLYGGFDPSSGVRELSDQRIVPSKDNWSPSGTILSGDFDDDDVLGAVPAVGARTLENRIDNAYHVIVANNEIDESYVFIDGITVYGGEANGEGNSDLINGVSISRSNGAGMHISGTFTTATITASSFVNNTAEYSGGAILFSRHPAVSLAISSSSLMHNSASRGGAILVSAAVSTALTLTDVVCNHNSASSSGGSIYASGSVTNSVNLTRTTLGQNSAAGLGGGIYTYSSSSSSNVSLNASKVIGNVATDGGGVYQDSWSQGSSLVTINSLIAGNIASGEGAVLYSKSSRGSINISSSTIVGNIGSSYVTLTGELDAGYIVTNSIVFANFISLESNTPSLFEKPTGNSVNTFKNSLIQHESSVAEGNLDGTSETYTLANLFKDAGNNDYSLKDDSPLKGLGDIAHYNNYGNANTDKDLAGNARVFDGSLDIGAFENQFTSAMPVRFGAFKTTLKNGQIELKWNTLTEVNNANFSIQRSIDGINYTQLNRVVSKGGAGENSYSIYDDQPLHGVNYYRLWQTDIDGKTTFLADALATFNLKDEDVQVWPNPIKDKVTVTADDKKYQKIAIYNTVGRRLQELKITSKQSIIDFVNYPAGIYIFKLMGSGGIQTLRARKL